MEVTRKARNVVMRPNRLSFYESSFQVLMSKGYLHFKVPGYGNVLLIQTLKTLYLFQTYKTAQLVLLSTDLLHFKSCLEQTTWEQQMDACMNNCMSSIVND